MSKLVGAVTNKDHSSGPGTAPATLVEYGDYQCPSCGDAHKIVQRVQKHFGDKLRFVFRNFPLDMHPNAQRAAEAAEFAASKDHFWKMHDLLYTHQRELGDATLGKLATEAELSADDLQQALNDGTFEARVKKDLDSGQASGVQGTPAFYLNGKSFDGDYDYDSLVAAIEALLPPEKPTEE